MFWAPAIITSPVEMKLPETICSSNRTSSQSWLKAKQPIIRAGFRKYSEYLDLFLLLSCVCYANSDRDKTRNINLFTPKTLYRWDYKTKPLNPPILCVCLPYKSALAILIFWYWILTKRQLNFPFLCLIYWFESNLERFKQMLVIHQIG